MKLVSKDMVGFFRSFTGSPSSRIRRPAGFSASFLAQFCGSPAPHFFCHPI
jgi:hypothetical protein